MFVPLVFGLYEEHEDTPSGYLVFSKLPFVHVLRLRRPRSSSAGRAERPHSVSVCQSQVLALPLLASFWNTKHVFPHISKAQPNTSE